MWLPSYVSVSWTFRRRRWFDTLLPPAYSAVKDPPFRGRLAQQANGPPLRISTAMRSSSLMFTAPQRIEQLLSTGCDPWPKEVLVSC